MEPRSGEEKFGRLPEEALELYGYAVQVIAAADGRLTREEREIVFEDARLLGVPQEIIDRWIAFNWRSETVTSILTRMKSHLSERMARRILYGAIRIALADDVYAIDERAAIDEASDFMGVNRKEVEAIGALVRLEMGVAVLRNGLLLD